MQSITCQNKEVVFLFASMLILCSLFHSLNAVSGEMKTADLPKNLVGDKWKFSVDYIGPYEMLGTMTVEITNDSYLISQVGSNYECYEDTINGAGQVYGENYSGTWTWFQMEYDVNPDFSWAKIATTVNSTFTYAGNTHTSFYQEEVTYNPPLEVDKGFPLSVGKGWSAAATETNTTMFTIDGKTEQYTNVTTQTSEFFVVRTDMTTVSAGEFETFVVRRTYPDGTYEESYYSPKAHVDVKWITYDSTGKVTSTAELLEYTLASEGFPIIYILTGIIVAAVVIVGGLVYFLFRRSKKSQFVPKPPERVQVNTEKRARRIPRIGNVITLLPEPFSVICP